MNGTITIEVEGIRFSAHLDLDRSRGESDMEKAIEKLKKAGIKIKSTNYGYLD